VKQEKLGNYLLSHGISDNFIVPSRAIFSLQFDHAAHEIKMSIKLKNKL
jgi:hypothetical protein